MTRTRKGTATPLTSEINAGSDYTDEELAWLKAVSDYKREHHRPWPSWCEILHLLKSLGYEKTGGGP